MNPSSGSFGPLNVWVLGTWTSELCDISLQNFQNSGDNRWGILRWKENNTTDTSAGYVRVDILDSNDTVLKSNLIGNTIINNTRFNRNIDLSVFSNVATTDIKIRFKLYSLTAQPSVQNPELNCKKKW